MRLNGKARDYTLLGDCMSAEKSIAHRSEGVSRTTPPVQHSTPDDVLNPLSLYRLARKAVSGENPTDPMAASSPTSVHAGSLGGNAGTSITSPAAQSAGRRGCHGRPQEDSRTRVLQPASAECVGAGAEQDPATATGQDGAVAPTNMLATPATGEPGLHVEVPPACPVIPEFALDLDDLQYYLTWGLDSIATVNDAGGMESVVLPAWMGSAEMGDGGMS